MSKTTIVEVFWKRISDTPDADAILFKEEGRFKALSWKEYGDMVRALSAALISREIGKGTNVAILCDNCPRWSMADMAILSAGAHSVPVYSTLAPDEVAYILRHSQAELLFAGDSTQAEKILAHETSPPETLEHVVIMDDSMPENHRGDSIKVISWSDFLASGRDYLADSDNNSSVDRRIASIEEEDLCTIVYTSGTTGFPKGAMILHRNIGAVLEAMAQIIK